MSTATFPFSIPLQPDDESCGIACLLGVYKHYGMKIDFASLSKEVDMLETGGTLGVNLGLHALKQGFNVSLTSYNLQVFDPSWSNLDEWNLIQKLEKQAVEKSDDPKLVEVSQTYIDFLERGGSISLCTNALDCIDICAREKIPIIVGLSSTYLYQSKREIPATTELDDVKGYPAGHFVVLNGCSIDRQKISVCDPYESNPFSKENRAYMVDKDHFLTSVFLGIVTYDANFLIIRTK